MPNATLVKEGTSLAALYQNKSVAEQNSVDLAWDVLMEDRYSGKYLANAAAVGVVDDLHFRMGSV